MKNFFLKAWYESGDKAYWFLKPLSALYNVITIARRKGFQIGVCPQSLIPVPVIVVGNITVGGTGKTPIVIELANYLKQKGFKPGIVSRGYGGRAEDFPLLVSDKSIIEDTGDEPMLIYKRTDLPVVIDPQRSRAAKLLAFDGNCDVIISDDGLQHYALDRHFEIVVIDGERIFGNGYLLPAGPLRESKARLKDFQLIVLNTPKTEAVDLVKAHSGDTPISSMEFLSGSFESVNDAFMESFPSKNAKVHAVAGIGNPERFFDCLRDMGFDIIPHPFDDHYNFKEKDLVFNDELPVIMTEKDAVKCTQFSAANLWYLPVKADLSDEFYQGINKFLRIK